MARSDGTVYINTLVDTKGFGKGMNGIKSQMGGLSGAVGKLGIAIAAAFSVKALINFSKEAIKLGSDLQEVQNVVDVTFATMSEDVNEFAKGAAEAAGLSETMAKRYMGTFGAMSKAFGFMEDEAFSMSATLTQAVGDVASFYNLTQDEAYTKLKSVFTGETESLKDLGVVMTQSALDAYAMAEGYGKTTKYMSEQEKVALRYAFVLDQLSASQGDFVRTSDSWANQTRILSLNFDSFKANIGQALINIFTPFLKVINQIVAKMAQLSQHFVAFSEMLVGKSTSGGGGSPGDALAEIESGYEDIADATDKATKAQKKYTTGLDEIRTFSDGSQDSSASGSFLKPGLTPGGDNSSAEKTESLIDRLRKKLNEFKNDIPIINSVFSIMGSSIRLVKDVAMDLYNLLTRPFTDNKDGFLVAAGNIALFLKDTLETIFAGLDEAMQYFVSVYEQSISPVIEGITEDLSGLVGEVLAWFNDYMGPVLERWGEKFSELWKNHISPLLTKIADFFGKIAEGVGTLWDKILYPFVSWIATEILPAITPALESIGNVFMIIFGKIADIIGNFIDILEGIIDVIVGVFTGDWKKAWNGIKDILKQIVNVCKNVISLFVDSAKELFGGLKTAIINIWNSIKNSTIAIWNSIVGAIKNTINGLIYVINGMICGVINGINGMVSALNGIKFSVPNWVPEIGGESFGLNLGYVSAPQIPYLASGAVIPPNAPFMAVLGDQKHGTNIEAPLDTIKQAVREVVGNGSGGYYAFTAQINRRTLFEEMIDEAKLRQSTSGKNPFSLA